MRQMRAQFAWVIYLKALEFEEILNIDSLYIGKFNEEMLLVEVSIMNF